MRPRNATQIGKLHLGENDALNLAMELHAELLLVDDREAYKEAIARDLNAIGTVQVLELAAGQKLLDLQQAFEKIKQTDFWISHQLLDERLKHFIQQQSKPTP